LILGKGEDGQLIAPDEAIAVTAAGIRSRRLGRQSRHDKQKNPYNFLHRKILLIEP
jgi:hypothetical protein